MARLDGKRIVFLTASSGVEQVELTTPWATLREAGAETVLAAPDASTVQGFTDDVDQADTFEPDLAVADLDVDSFDALVLPGGTTNADALRLDEQAVAAVRRFVEAGKPVAAICHAPWTLATADVLRGKTMTSYPSLQTDLRNAGATWVDQECVTCPANGWTLVTSRTPADLEAFGRAAVDAFA